MNNYPLLLSSILEITFQNFTYSFRIHYVLQIILFYFLILFDVPIVRSCQMTKKTIIATLITEPLDKYKYIDNNYYSKRVVHSRKNYENK